MSQFMSHVLFVYMYYQRMQLKTGGGVARRRLGVVVKQKCELILSD